jgi:glycosyltransferase involved in cell wall biosynthesis
MFSLDSWLIDGKDPEIMPAVYEFYTYLGNSSDHSFDAIIAHRSIDKVIEFPNGSKIYIQKLNLPVHYIRKFASLRFLKRKAKEMLKADRNYTHVYGMTIYANVARELGKEYNLPSVGRLYGSLIWDVLQKGQWIRANTRFYYQLREIKSPCDVTICTEDGTEFDAAIHKYSPTAKVYMLYNGINKDLRKELLSIPSVNAIDSSKEIRFCYIARLTYWKRQDLAIDIIYRLKNKGLKVSLDIYGRGETESRLSAKIMKLNLTNEVTIKGSIPHDQIPKVLSKYQVAMFLYEASNLGNSMWEASLSGRVIITRGTGKTADIFNNQNSIIMVGDNTQNVVSDFMSLLTTNTNLTVKSREAINLLLPSWEYRFNEEMKIISKV